MEQAQPENSIFVFRCQEACVYLLNNFDWCLDPPVQNLEYKWLPVSRPANPPPSPLPSGITPYLAEVTPARDAQYAP